MRSFAVLPFIAAVVGQSVSSSAYACGNTTTVATLANGAIATVTRPSNASCLATVTSASVSTSVYTPAPWLVAVSQTTITYVESIVAAGSTVFKTFAFAVPASSAYDAYTSELAQTVTVLSCPGSGSATTIVPDVPTAAPATPAAPAAIPAATTDVGTTEYLTTVLSTSLSTSLYVTEIYTTVTEYFTNAAGATTSSSAQAALTTVTSTIVVPVTVTVASTVTSTVSGVAGVAVGANAGLTAEPTTASTTTESDVLSTSTSSSNVVLSTGLYANSSSSASVSSSGAFSASAVRTSSASVSMRTTASAMASSVSRNATSTTDSACPIGTIAVSGTAPAPPTGINVYNISGNAPYSLSEAELLAAISFPNGFNCKNKLVILQPGTAIPAPDTFSNTFIPVFEQDVVEGGVDIMMLTNPSISLAPVWQTAEFVAYALDYANLVLNRPGTIIAWSQGNLNTQWAFKYWPSTRTNVTGRNYVAMSADYDGTILGTFVCEPISILTSGSGATLVDQFITDGGLTSVLGLLGFNTLPVSANGTTDPVAIKTLLWSLVFTDAATNGLGITNSTVSSSASRASATQSVAASASSVRFAGNGTIPTAAALVPKKRAVPFGDKQAIVSKLEAELVKRNTFVGALGDLLSGVLSPIATELASIIIDPSADLQQVFANIATLVTDPSTFSLPPQGCAPGLWDQVYFSPFVTKLAENGGALAYVPTTSIFSLTDEVVEPQGVTGQQDASAYLSGSNPGVIAPENIYIQDSDKCTVISAVADLDFPPIISHEGVLTSGMGVAAAILAVNSGSTVSYAQIVATYGKAEACSLLSQYLTTADLLGNEATVPGGLERVTISPGTTDPSAQFVAEPVPLPAYSNNY